MHHTPSHKRPLGITIITILLVLEGILALSGSALNLLNANKVLNSLFFISAALLFLDGVFLLVLAWGLWTLRRWAFWGTVIFEVLSLLTLLNGVSSAFSLLQPLIALIVLIYLFADRAVRRAFHT